MLERRRRMNGIEGARRINTNYGMPVFSRIELRDIALAVGTLTVAFTLIFFRNRLFSDDFLTNTLCWIAASFVIVMLSFMLHELGHKFTAQRYGVWSEFRMYPVGLLLCLLMSLFGFLFAAPGAVYIRGYLTEEMNGKISAAGPGVNIVISAVTLLLSVVVPNGLSASIFYLISYMNAFLALFNMLPIAPLDGSKIVRWNMTVYIVMIALAGVLFLATWFI